MKKTFNVSSNRMSYESAGFSVEGSVDGDFSTEDVKRSYDSKSDQLIRPNIVSDEVSQILIDLQKLAAGDSSTENFESLSSNAQRLLGGDKLDPIKAVVVALDSVDAVHSLFVDSPEYEVRCSLSITAPRSSSTFFLFRCFVVSGHCRFHAISERNVC